MPPPPTAAIHRVRTRPRTGTDEPTSRDLLHELLTAFGLHQAPRIWESESRHPGAADGLPTDPAERRKQFDHQLDIVAPTLRDLVGRVRAIASSPLPHPNEYRRRWFGIVEGWNGAVANPKDELTMLPPLCESCGRPVVLRRPEHLQGGEIEPSTVCSEPCRARRKSRLAAARRKAGGTEPV